MGEDFLQTEVATKSGRAGLEKTVSAALHMLEA